MVNMRCPAGRVHVRWVENNAVNRPILVWEASTVHPGLEVSRQELVRIGRDISPENPLPIGYVSDSAARLNIERKDKREYLVVCADVCTENEIVGRCAVRRFTLFPGRHQKPVNPCGV